MNARPIADNLEGQRLPPGGGLLDGGGELDGHGLGGILEEGRAGGLGELDAVVQDRQGQERPAFGSPPSAEREWRSETTRSVPRPSSTWIPLESEKSRRES